MARQIGAGGVVTLAPGQHGPAGTSKPSGWSNLCAVVANEVTSHVLRVRTYAPADLYTEGVGFYAGDPVGNLATLNQLNDCGILRIQLGASLARTIYADLQAGDYLVPAATNVQVSAARYSPLSPATPVLASVGIQAELVPCESQADYKPFTQTGYGVIAGAGNASMRVPSGAYALDVQSERGINPQPASTDWTYDAKNGPIFECSAGNVYLLRDFQLQVAFPGGMVPLAGPCAIGSSPHRLTVSNRAAAGSHVCKAIFYVR